MRLATTLTLAGITLTALGYVFFIDRHAEGTSARIESAQQPLQWKKDEVRLLEISRHQQPKLIMERSSDRTWNLTAPVNERADQALTLELLDIVENAQLITRIDLDSDEKNLAKKLSEYGLDPALAIDVTFHRESEKVTLRLGRTAPEPGTFYAQKIELNASSAKGIIVLKLPKLDWWAKLNGSWRDPYLVGMPLQRLEKVSFRRHNLQLVFQRQVPPPDAPANLGPGRWQIVEPVAARANHETIDTVLKGLAAEKILSLHEPKEPVDLSTAPTIGEKGIEIKLWLAGQSEAQRTLTIMPDENQPTLALAWVSGRPGVFHISRELLALQQAEVEDVRDLKLAALDKNALRQLEVQWRDRAPIRLQRPKESWQLMMNDQLVEANAEKVERLIKALNESEAMALGQTTPAQETFGLDKPELILRFADVIKAEAPSLELKLGLENKRFFAQWSNQPTVYRLVDPRWLSEISREPYQYQSTALLNFWPLSVRSLSLQSATEAPVELSYQINGNQWSAQRQGQDLTNLIDAAALESIVNELSRLSAIEWSSDSQPGLVALKNPLFRVQLSLEKFDDVKTAPSDTAGRMQRVTLDFASTNGQMQLTPFIYGRMNDSDRVFIMKKELLQKMMQPVLKRAETR
jgi:hypothetical protein